MNRIPWKSDGDGEYFVVKNDDIENARVDRHNTAIYRHTPEHSKLDHFFVKLSGSTGYFVWRKLVEQAVSETAYDEMTDEMFKHGFDVVYMPEPDKGDIEVWEDYFEQDYKPDSPIRLKDRYKKIAKEAMKNFDAEARYYLAEWTD